MASRNGSTSWTRKETWHGHELETECTVSYSVSGRHRPMRWGPDGGSPEEFPEVEIDSVTIDATGEDIQGELDESEIDAIEEEILSGCDDGDDDDRRYDEMRDRRMGV